MEVSGGLGSPVSFTLRRGCCWETRFTRIMMNGSVPQGTTRGRGQGSGGVRGQSPLAGAKDPNRYQDISGEKRSGIHHHWLSALQSILGTHTHTHVILNNCNVCSRFSDIPFRRSRNITLRRKVRLPKKRKSHYFLIKFLPQNKSTVSLKWIEIDVTNFPCPHF